MYQETGMKIYLHGPMDYAETLKLHFRIRDLDLRKRGVPVVGWWRKNAHRAAFGVTQTRVEPTHWETVNCTRRNGTCQRNILGKYREVAWRTLIHLIVARKRSRSVEIDGHWRPKRKEIECYTFFTIRCANKKCNKWKNPAERLNVRGLYLEYEWCSVSNGMRDQWSNE